MMANRVISKYESMPVQVRASVWFLICSFFQKAVSIITTPIFTRIMSTAEYGRYGVFNSWYGIISIVVALALTGGVHVQGLVKFEQNHEVYSSSLQGLTFTLVLVWFGVYLGFRNFWNDLFSLSTIQMISMFMIIWMTAVFGFWANEQRVKYSYRILVSVTIISALLRSGIEIVLVLFSKDKATAKIVGWAIADTIAFAWMFFYQLYNGRIFFSKQFWTYALSFNIPLIPHYLSQMVLNSSDRIMIERIVGEDEAGIYNLAYSLSLIMALFNSALTQTINPWMYKKIKDNRTRDIAPVAYLTLMLIGFVNTILILLAPEALYIFAPKTYHEAIWVIPPVSMSVFFMYSYELYAKHAFYYEKTKIIMVASVLGALLNIILNFYFIGMLGYIAAGYTTLLCFIVYASAHYLFMRKVCRECCEGVYPYDTRWILVITISFVLVGFLCMATYNYPLIRYGIVVFVIIALMIQRKRIIISVNKLIELKREFDVQS